MIHTKKAVSVSLLLLVTGFLAAPLYAATYTITVDGAVRQGTIPHFWSECVGTGTMEYCLKPEWRVAARIGAQEAGFKRVRGHGILIHWNNVDNIHVGTSPNWNFSVINQIYDTLIACGLRPVVELDFMPQSMQSNGVISPPSNYNTWKGFVAALAQNLISRYGAAEARKWYWEVWNEYDYPGFWNSDAAHYYTLYDSASRGVRSVDTNILIGGPATTGSGPLQNFWNNCNAYGIKSLTNHNYGAAPGNTSDPVNIRSDNRVRSGVIRSSGRNLLSLNTEYNSTYGGAGGNTSANCYSMDSHINASFVAKTVKLIIADCIGGSYNYPDVLSYWALSDVFDECGSNNLNSYIEYRNYIPFGQVFGLINYQGIRKAAFNAFKMLHTLGNTGLSLTGGSGDADGVDGIATVSADTSEVKILIYSYYTAFNVTSADNTVNLIVNHLPFANGQSLTVHHYRIDSLHNNPYGVWQRLGSPAVPTTAQWDSLRAHDGRNGLDSLEASTTITYTGATLTKSFAIPRYGVSLLTYAKYIPTKVVTTVKPVGHVNLSMRGTRLIVSDQQKGPVNILIFSADGRFLKEYRVTQGSFDLRKDLSRGFYLVRAEADGMRIVRKMMVQ